MDLWKASPLADWYGRRAIVYGKYKVAYCPHSEMIWIDESSRAVHVELRCVACVVDMMYKLRIAHSYGLEMDPAKRQYFVRTAHTQKKTYCCCKMPPLRLWERCDAWACASWLLIEHLGNDVYPLIFNVYLALCLKDTETAIRQWNWPRYTRVEWRPEKQTTK